MSAPELSPADRKLMASIARVDVMDTAGKLIANPRRAMVSLAGQVAMAITIERSQGALIEARLLLAALELPETGNERDEAVKDHAIQTQMHRLRAELAALDGRAENPQENDDASSHP